MNRKSATYSHSYNETKMKVSHQTLPFCPLNCVSPQDLPIFASDASAASPPSGSEDAPAVQDGDATCAALGWRKEVWPDCCVAQVQRSISGDQEAPMHTMNIFFRR